MIVPGLGEPFSREGFQRLTQAVRALALGGSNALGPVVTLAQGQTETTVMDRRCAGTSLPLLVPTSAAAAGAGVWVKSVGDGSFVLGHASVGAGASLRYELRQS